MTSCSTGDKDGDGRSVRGRATSSPRENWYFPQKNRSQCVWGDPQTESHGCLPAYRSGVTAQDPGRGPPRDPRCFFLALKKIINHLHSLSREWGQLTREPRRVKTHVKQTGRQLPAHPLHIHSFLLQSCSPGKSREMTGDFPNLFMEKDTAASGKLSSSVQCSVKSTVSKTGQRQGCADILQVD